MVFGLHLKSALGIELPGPLVLVSSHGGAGVVVFFVISGFVLYRPFLSDRPPQLADYALRRFVRIFPAYLLAIGGAVLMTGGAALFSADPVGYLTMTHDYAVPAYSGLLAVVWTLQAEACFYIALPFIAALVGGHRSRIALLAAGSFALAWVVSLERVGLVLGVPMALITFWAFAAGMMIATLRTVPSGLAIPFGCVFISIGLIVGLPQWLDGFTALGAAMLVAGASGATSKLLQPPGWLGDRLSYPFYLWHVTVLNAVAVVGGWLAAVIALALTIVVSLCSSLLVERPLMRSARRLSRRGDRHPAPVGER